MGSPVSNSPFGALPIHPIHAGDMDNNTRDRRKKKKG